MSIDVKTPPPRLADGSYAPATADGAGYLLASLSRQLLDPKRQADLKLLDDWCNGEQPLAGAPPAARQAVRDFSEHSSGGFANLLVEALCNRRRVRGIATAADDDTTGDGRAWRLWEDMGCPTISADVHRLEARFGQAYVLVSPPAADEPDIPVVTAEDPRSTIAELDPARPWVPRAGLKMLHDPSAKVTRAFLYRPGRVDVAEVEAKSSSAVRFNPQAWNWNADLSLSFGAGGAPGDGALMPLIPFENLGGRSEISGHLRLLRRIDFMILQQLTIAVLQAFKQRAVKGVPLNDPATGEPIDYNDILAADPGALWLLPATAELWESGQVDLSGIISAATSYIRQLAAVSQTPMYMFDAGGENQSAEGAALADAGLIFKAKDRNSRDTRRWARVVHTSYRWLGRDVSGVRPIWADPKLVSLSEQASALSQLAAGGVPFRTRLIWVGKDPAEVDQAEVEREDDLVFGARVAAMKADQTPAQTPSPQTPPAAAQAPQGAPNGAAGSASEAPATGAAPGGTQGAVQAA